MGEESAPYGTLYVTTVMEAMNYIAYLATGARPQLNSLPYSKQMELMKYALAQGWVEITPAMDGFHTTDRFPTYLVKGAIPTVIPVNNDKLN